MKSIASLLSIIALGFGLVGCPGGGGGGGGTGTASGSFTRVALVPNRADDTVSVFLVDNANGRLRPRGYVVSGDEPRAVAVHPSGKFFYTINGLSNNVSAYTLSSTGLATAVTGSPFLLTSATGPTAVAVSPDGQFLFVSNDGGIPNNISVFSINQTSGVLTEISGSPFTLGSASGPTAIAVHPSGNLLFVTNNTNNPSLQGTLSVFIVQSTGFLNPVGFPLPLLRDPQALALNATGTVVYVANKGDNKISTFSVDQNTGVLVPIGTPFLTGTAPSSLAVGPGGQFLYVANSGGTTNISWIPIDPVSGALISGSSNVAVASPEFIRIDPAGRLLYATDSTSDLASIFSIDSVTGTGALTLVGTRAMRDNPAAVAFVSGTAAVIPTPTFAYVTNAVDNTLSAFAITPASGLLTEIFGSPFPVTLGTGPVALTADPLAKFLYVANGTPGNVSGFSINQTSSVLVEHAAALSLPASPNPQSVAADPSGRHLYVVNQGNDSVSVFSIASGTGVLTAVTGSPFPTGVGTGPRAVTVEPSGRFAYVVNATSNEVSQFTITQTTGALGAGVALPLAVTAAPRAVTVDPTGRFLYVANNGTDTVSAYLIAAADGSLTAIGSPILVTPETGPVSLSADPLGKFLYVANATSGSVSVFLINPATGALSAIGSPVAASSPQSITVDLSGQFVYVANGSPNNSVSAFIIQANGGLINTSIVTGSPFAAGANPSAITTVGQF